MVSSRYTDALDLGQGSKIGLHKLYGNRSLAYIKAQRYHEAAADAERCIELAPQWPKGYWRLGMALLGLKQTLQAIQAFTECWRLDHSKVPSTCQFPVPVKASTWRQNACVSGAVSCLHTRLWVLQGQAWYNACLAQVCRCMQYSQGPMHLCNSTSMHKTQAVHCHVVWVLDVLTCAMC